MGNNFDKRELLRLKLSKSPWDHSFSMYANFPKIKLYLPPDVQTYEYLSGAKKC